MMRWAVFLCLLCACASDSAQRRVSVALAARGSAARAVAVGDASVTLTRADLAFGPIYFCASQIGRAELCETAIAESLQVVQLSALDPSTRMMGTLDATTGTVMSAIYDFGISWLLTENEPAPDPGNASGHSAVFEGTITRAGQTLRFSATVDAEPRVKGDLTVNAQRTTHAITGEGEQVTLLIDANTWIDRLQIDQLFALDHDGDGSIEIPANSESWESIYQGMLNRTPIGFTWSTP